MFHYDRDVWLETFLSSKTMADGEDLNPRYACTYTGFRDQHNQPLCHPSEDLSDTSKQGCQGSITRVVLLVSYLAGLSRECRQTLGLGQNTKIS